MDRQDIEVVYDTASAERMDWDNRDSIVLRNQAGAILAVIAVDDVFDEYGNRFES